MRASLKFGLAVGVLVLGYGCAGIAPGVKTPALPPLATGAPQEFRVMLAPGNDPKAGRLIVVAAPVAAVRVSAALPHPPALTTAPGSFIAAQETSFVAPAQPVRFDADMLAYPRPLSRIAPGEYWVQVRLDINRNAAYRLTDVENDFTSVPIKMQLPSAGPVNVTLVPERDVVKAGSPPAPAGSPAARDVSRR